MDLKIPSRQEVKDILHEVSKSGNYEGSAVEFHESVAATGYYEAIMRAISILRESNPETAANINSLISLAVSRMYHVYRGNNPVITLTVSSMSYQKLLRGTKLYSSDKFNLYVRDDVIVSTDNVKIPCIASKNFIQSSKKNKSDRYYVEFLNPNLSEDLNLYVQTDQTQYLENTGHLVTTKKIFREHSEDRSNDSILELTIQDFGVRFYRKEKTDANFTISAFEYLENPNDDISSFIEEYKNNPQNLKLELSDLSVYSVLEDVAHNRLFTPSIPRETKDEIKLNYNSQIDSIYLVRSSSDLADAFRIRFANKSSQVSIKNFRAATDVPKIVNSIYRVPAGSINYPAVFYFYVPKIETETILSSEMKNFIDQVRFYYLFDNLYACPGEAVPINVTINIRTNDSGQALRDIEEILSVYEKKFNYVLKRSQLLTQIAKLSEINEIIDVNITKSGITRITDFPTQGYLNQSGFVLEHPDYLCTDFIPVMPGDTVYLTGYDTGYENNEILAGYNTKGDVYEFVKIPLPQHDHEFERLKVIIPENVDAIRYSANKEDVQSGVTPLLELETRLPLDEVPCQEYEYFKLTSQIITE